MPKPMISYQAPANDSIVHDKWQWNQTNGRLIEGNGLNAPIGDSTTYSPGLYMEGQKHSHRGAKHGNSAIDNEAAHEMFETPRDMYKNLHNKKPKGKCQKFRGIF